MIQTVKKPVKIALCRRCSGLGTIEESAEGTSDTTCPQCDGSGRVTVSGVITLDIRPYRTKKKINMGE